MGLMFRQASDNSLTCLVPRGAVGFFPIRPFDDLGR
jgi:hypothetical protein